MAKAPTIVDIANNLGVSPISVSRALRNAGHVSEALRQEILSEARRLGYSPNNAARALRNNASYLIGLIVPNFFSYQIDELVTEIQNYSQVNDHGLILGLTQWSSKTEIEQLDFMSSKNVDGIIIKSYGSREVIEKIDELVADGIQVVCLLDDFHCRACNVMVDNIAGGRIAGSFLIQNSHRKICYATYEEARKGTYSTSHFSSERFEGLKQALKQNHLRIGPEDILYVERQHPNEPFSAKIFNIVLEKIQNYTAVFCYDDYLAAGILKILQQNGIRVPQDCSIIGFDDSPAVSHWSDPAVTVIKQPDRLIALEAVNLILQKNQEEPAAGKENRLFEPELVIRDSVKNMVNPVSAR